MEGDDERRLSVTIITPSFNQGRYLLETLRSVANQDYPDVQHIVMDGGSTDGSAELLEAWARSHEIVWQSQPDGGQAAAIQAGIERARGDIVAWLNSDDLYLDAGVISDVVELFRAGADAVTGAGWYISESGERTKKIPVLDRRLDFDALRGVDWILQPATFFRRDVLLRFPIDTSLTFAFDWDLFIRMAREITFTPIDRHIAGYRLHPSGKSISGAGRRKRELLDVAGRYNSRGSTRYRLMRMLVRGYERADAFPRPLNRTRSVFTAVAAVTHKLPGNRGIQF